MTTKPEPVKQDDAAGVATRRATMRLLDAVLRQGLPLEAAMPGATAELDRADDRAFARAIAAEVLRRLPDLDALIDTATTKRLPGDSKARFALRIALAQALALGTPHHATIATVLPLMDGGPRRLVHGVFGTIIRGEAKLPEPPGLPKAISKRWRKAWGAGAADAARHAIAAPPPIDLTLRDPAMTMQWVERLGGMSLAPGHVRLARGGAVSELPGFADGEWWVQDIAASLPARVLGKGEGRAVLDLCAAPGGKTMQLAAAGWAVTATDLSEPRLERLRENLARTKLSADVRQADVMAEEPEPRFDAVLLDAPCSATGIFRRHPDVIHRVTDRAIAALAEQQAAMLRRAAGWVKPGGVLVYAVCSLEPAEGEGVADGFATERDFIRDPILAEELPDGIIPGAAGRVRVLPGALGEAGGADGFFVARFRRA
ncbi:RsmB/NOP family class I SAM-dependent RNA methyltransferase [Sphingomonas sp. KC8]|uniref:RsmB/NOP family class I SAM-dependent RNA methyltransferase n=1 Tax=Sphingomonas sp. KC8 TaxID=1030157 RepID=UPI000248A3D8|nr:methyltransferase domain-containing protein [Sphingomonas sp. KC8]ARS29160.1 Fmu (Sun) domain-containing protein [Sphingomonas sp. KC8]